MRGLALPVLVLVACAGPKGKGPVREDFASADLLVLGPLQFGQTGRAAYHDGPRFMAYRMTARAGEHVAIDVRSADGVPMVWLLDGKLRAIAADDAGDSNQAHVELTLPESDDITYTVAIREAQLFDATFVTQIAAPPHDLARWRGRSIYFVMTDRFANGDPSNDRAGGFGGDWHGGDLQGVIDHLDYIAGMGFTGLWITPVIEQHSDHAYHGYHGWDFSKLDGHLGDLAKLRELVAGAHARGIAVMLDTVANHTGRYDYQAPTFPDPAMYHHNGGITDFGNPAQVENNDLAGLNDLAQEHPVVHQALLDHVRWLVASSGADGLRVDTVKHVPAPFWRDWNAAAGVYTLGEILDGSVQKVASYSYQLDASLDYPLYFAIRDAFAKGGSARALGGVLGQDAAYSDPLLAGVFVDNHDQPRFLCEAGGALDRLQLALAFALTTRGVPIVYYGTEQAFADCGNNRQDMAGHFDANAPLYGWLQKLHAARAATPALRTGAQHERWQDDTAYAFEREDGASAALVAFNTGGATRTLALHDMHVPPGTAFHDALGGAASATVDGSGGTTVTIPPRTVLVLVH